VVLLYINAWEAVDSVSYTTGILKNVSYKLHFVHCILPCMYTDNNKMTQNAQVSTGVTAQCCHM